MTARFGLPAPRAHWFALALLAGGACVGVRSPAAAAGQAHAWVFAAVGQEMRSYALDAAHAMLSERHVVTLPADVQSAWAQPEGRFLLVAWSDGTNVSPGTRHALSTVRIDPRSADLTMQGKLIDLPSRPIFVSTDRSTRHALITYTSPSGVTVHALDGQGMAGAALPQSPAPMGVYGHQFVVDPSNRVAILVGRGNVPSASRPEDPGSLEVFAYHEGTLRHELTIAPEGGVGFHPRYIEFHPMRPWLYVSLSQQNALGVYRRSQAGFPEAQRLFEVSSLQDPSHVQAGQLSGALHLHPNGRVAYLANRAVASTPVEGKAVSNGGENSIAVFALDARSGEPRLVQTVDTRGIGPVEFALDPSAHLLVVANMMQQWRRDTAGLRAVEPSLVVFRVRDDGTLTFAQQLDVPAQGRNLFWMGMSARP